MYLMKGLILLVIALSVVAKKPRDYRPVVIYHGLGDTAKSQGMIKIKEIIESELEGVYVKNIQIGENENEDRDHTFMDNSNRQIDEVCKKLAQDENLVDGFNAIGFSQGGLFLRAYVERCNNPPVYNLITFGSPHNGVGEVPKCGDKSDYICHVASSLIRRGVYLSFVQERVVQAQYYKDMKNYDTYLKASIFLADINNERPNHKNPQYASNMAMLNKLAMIQFINDTTLMPKESSWFGYYNADKTEILDMKDLPIYKEDWIGLKKLDRLGKLDFIHTEGDHMQFSAEFFVDSVVKPYLAEPLPALTIGDVEDTFLGLVKQN